MPSAMNYKMTDIYGGYDGVTEQTIPEPEDQMAMVDDSKTAQATGTKTANSVPILVAIATICVVALVLGALK